MIDIKKCKYRIVIDSREKKCKHITKVYDAGFEFKPSQHDQATNKPSKFSKPILYREREKGLKTGDFTIEIQTPAGNIVNFKDKIVIERKASLSEICGNLYDKKSIDADKRNRFERELLRAKESNIKLILLIEVSEGYDRALSGAFRYDIASKVAPANFMAQILALKARYNFELVFLNKNHSARYIHDVLYYEAREYLKGMED